jgi:hypothetical protein
MADKSITIVLRAKNAIATGLASARAGIVGFGKAVKFALSSTLGVIMAIYGAFKAVQRIIGWVTDAMNAHVRAQREAVKAGAAEAVNRVADAFAALSKNIKEANEASKASIKQVDLEISAYRKLADAKREAQKQARIGRVAGTDEESLQAIEESFKARDAEIKAARELHDLMLKRARLDEEAKSRRKEAAQLAREEQIAANSATFQADRAARVRGKPKDNKEMLDAVAESIAKINEAREKMLAQAAEALKDAERLAKESAVVDIEIQAAKIARRAQLEEDANAKRIARDKAIAEHTAAQAKAHADELLAEQKKLNDQRAKLDEEMVRAKEDAAQKAARAELDALQEAERKRERMAENTVQGFLDELNAKRAAEKQWEQDQKKAERLRNVKGQQAQDFVRAVDAIKAARGQANPMQLQIAAAQKAVEEAGKQVRKLEDIERELKQNGVMMKNLLGLG